MKPEAGITLCIVDTYCHALAARAMRLSLAGMDFADALFLSDSGLDTGGARHVAIPRLEGREAYSRFVMKDLLRHIETEHVLLIQWDGYVVNPEAWSEEFLGCDYIGARWGFRQDAHCVGNGGFSLRSRKLLEALQDEAVDRFEPEDERICREYRPFLESRYGIRFAPPELADRFAFETTYPQGHPLGFHGLFNIWRFLADAEVPEFIARMPDSVLGSIQYLALAKNFIDLRRLDAARAMLRRRLAVFPADAKCAAMLESVDPAPRARPAAGPPSRNAPCPCGSGQRYKNCCGREGAGTAAGSNAPEREQETLLRQAMAWHQEGRLAAAREAYERLLGMGDQPLAEHYLGVLDMQEGRPEAGERRIRAALAKQEGVPDFHNNLGLCLRAQGRLEEAVAEYRRALALDPSYAPAWSNVGLDLTKLGRGEEALAAFDKALALDASLAQARFSRSLVRLALGDYAEGWDDYEWRTRCPEYAANYRLPALPGQPAYWRGESLAGKRLLLISEQGIGDTVQFVRYAKPLADQGARVDLHVRKAHVAGLFRGAAGIDEVWVGEEAMPSYDYVCHLLSLPRLCGTRSLAAIPSQMPYLAVSGERRHYWRRRLDALPAGLKVGLSWSGSPTYADDRNRSCHFSAFAPWFDLPGVTWINLQLGAGREQMQATPNPVLDWGDDQTDYAETAALMCELDLVISVDTSISHVAAALGRPAWVMLQYAPDFRWLLDRDDSPWYPSARLFRQDSPGNWESVVGAVRAALAEKMAAV